MKANKYYKIASSFLLFLLIIAGCDLIDPTEVHNPSITDKNLLEDASGGTEPLIIGLEYAFSDAVRKTVAYTEIVSDNYVNTGTFFSTIIDKPRNIAPNEQYLNDSREIYFRLMYLNSLAAFGLKTIIPSDPLTTDAQKAEVYFYKGMSLLLLSENFAAFPIDENGPLVKASDALLIAVEDFKSSLSLNQGGNNAVNCKLALARVYRLLGDKVNAQAASNEALGLSQNHVFSAPFDPINLTNDIWTFTINRIGDDFEPLPRLDFLDPKYITKETGIPVLKSEEAYLILAEIAISNSNITEAKQQMINVITLALSRDIVQFADNDKRKDRPNLDSYKIKADASSPEETGLIFKRSGNTVNVHAISYTSLTENYINSLTSTNELYYALYLLRQQIFFSEGRRMSDLGIRLPVMQTEIDANATLNAGDYGTVAIIPSYIPADNEMDTFVMDEANSVATMNYDMNKIIVQNINVVSPFAQ